MSERAVAQQQQEKFEFYLLSLVFTLLALSVQTAKFGTSVVFDVLEIAGWACLLISGIAGLWRMETNPLIRVKVAQKQEFEDFIGKMKELQLQGTQTLYFIETSSDEPIADIIKNRQQAIQVLTPFIKKLEKQNNIKYLTHRFGFVLGVIFVVLARGWAALANSFTL